MLSHRRLPPLPLHVPVSSAKLRPFRCGWAPALAPGPASGSGLTLALVPILELGQVNAATPVPVLVLVVTQERCMR